MITIDDITLIDHFINEELDPIEKIKFEKRVRDDLEFSKEVRKQINAIKAIKTYESVKFMNSIEAQLPDWKAGGHKSYTPSVDMSRILLRILIPAMVLGISYAIFRIVSPPDDKKKTTPVEEQTPATNVETLDYFRMKNEGDSAPPELKINIENPETYKGKLLSSENGEYVYELEYDGKTVHLKSDDGNLLPAIQQNVDAEIDARKKDSLPPEE
ncbi:MAG: hypothetical protein GC181_14615 [Bacteroidetes bacterium]|nr:hypothetical protein [Bacteroidota bacterium]